MHEYNENLFCWNAAEPSAKPKDTALINSEQVPWGKGEKNLEKRSEKDFWN